MFCSRFFLRDTLTIGERNEKNVQLIDPANVLLPYLHITLDLFYIFVKALDRNLYAGLHLIKIFPDISDNKLKEGVLSGLQPERY